MTIAAGSGAAGVRGGGAVSGTGPAREAGVEGPEGGTSGEVGVEGGSGGGVETPRYTVAAMLGQVNGRPIYADAVLEPIVEQLAALGQTLPRVEFRKRAYQLISGRLSQIVADALLLGEAEQRLSDRERAGLQHLLKQEREELIRFWGRGSVAVADESLRVQTGRDLEETLEDTRQKLVVQQYLRQKLFSQIYVTRKDVERYYHEHQDEFNPPRTRLLRLIRVTEASVADEVEARLGAGESFESVAQMEANRYRREEGGLMSEPAVGEEVFSEPELNEAMLSLGVGERSRRVRLPDADWWVYVESMEEPAGRSLREVQLEIEESLRRQRFRDLTQRYREELFKNGSYDPIEEMAEALLEVAMSRYAPAE